jgi:CDP-diacylglycerol--serine O-phosphatidyltransferase
MAAGFLAHLRGLQLKDYLTLGNAASGALAVALALSREPAALLAILLGVVFDALDGLVARGRGKPNPFGVQLDSLADAVTFGLAPVALALAPVLGARLLTGEASLPLLTFASGAVYLACILVRLARFNLQKGKGYFEGLPSPAAGLLVAFVAAVDPADAWLALLVAGALAASGYRVPKPKLG